MTQELPDPNQIADWISEIVKPEAELNSCWIWEWEPTKDMESAALP